jgi:hypothetical protein
LSLEAATISVSLPLTVVAAVVFALESTLEAVVVYTSDSRYHGLTCGRDKGWIGKKEREAEN